MGEKAQFADFGLAITIIVSSNRYLLAFGGRNRISVPDKELVRTFDHLRPQCGWKTLTLTRPTQPCGTFYGVLNLTPDFLVFGGLDSHNKNMDSCLLF